MKVAPGHLTARQKLFCQHYVGAGKHCAALAARLAGYAPGCSHVTGCQLLQKPKIAATVRALEATLAAELSITRHEVIAQLVGAANLALERGEPGTVIAAWKQVAAMSGFYRDMGVVAGGMRPRDDALRAEYEAMSDAELAALVAGG